MRRVFVVGEAIRTILWATPVRVMSANCAGFTMRWTGNSSTQSAIWSGTASASDPISAPYLAVRERQSSLNLVVTATYFDTLRTGHAFSFASAVGIAEITAVEPQTLFTSAPSAKWKATIANIGHSATKVLEELLVSETSWLSLLVHFLSVVEVDRCEHVEWKV